MEQRKGCRWSQAMLVYGTGLLTGGAAIHLLELTASGARPAWIPGAVLTLVTSALVSANIIWRITRPISG